MTEIVKQTLVPPTPNQRLRQERERRCWSQQELADKVGTTPLNVSRWERGITVPGPHFRQKLREVFEKSTQELGLVVSEAEESKPIEAVMSASEAPAPLPPSTESPAALWNVPYRRNLFFTGRQDILTQLREVLISNEHPIALAQPQAISGLGGIGKTQTAVEYAYRYRDSYKAVFWVRADSHEVLVSDFLLIAALLNLPLHHLQDQNVIVQAVMRWLNSHEGWLLILDNADNLEIVNEFIPSLGKGHILLTTRAQSIGTIAQRIDVEKMGPDEGTVFLLRRIKRLKGNAPLESVPESVRKQVQAIVEAVDGLPLALDQAGAYIEEIGCGLSDYLKFYQKHRKRLLRARGQDAAGHPEPIATTWSLSFEKVERANLAAAELLRLCAFLHPDVIPEAMITEGAAELGPVLQPVAEDEFELNEAIGELRKYSLVKRDPEKKILNIHRLVQAVIKDGMNEQAQREWAERVVRMVNCAFPSAAFAMWDRCQEYLPHAQLCADLIEQWDMKFVEAAQLFSRTGNYLRQRAQYREAERLLQKALAICEQVLGSEHADVAHDMSSLAGLYVDMGKYAQAEILYQRTQDILERVLGPSHPDVAPTIRGLGSLYRERGNWELAESFHKQALAIRIQVFGSEHLDVAESLDDLAVVYNDQGKYAGSEELYKQAFAIRERFLGPDHPEVATCLNNIGWLYYRQGQYDLAEVPHLRALAISEKGLGPNHPNVALSLNALGLLYRDQADYAKAEQFLERALLIREEAFGPDHVDVGQSLQNLGVLYYLQGKYEQAEAMLKQSLRIREQLGANNVLVAYTLLPLAKLYRDQGRYDEAESLFQRTLAIREQMLGPDNIDVSYTLAALAVLYRNQGRYEEAEALFRRALAIQERVLDPGHPNTAQCLHDLGVFYLLQGKYSEAEPLLQSALAIREQRLVKGHPDTIATLEQYAELLRKTDRHTEAGVLAARIQASMPNTTV